MYTYFIYDICFIQAKTFKLQHSSLYALNTAHGIYNANSPDCIWYKSVGILKEALLATKLA